MLQLARMTTQILLVEDEAKVAKFIKDGLTLEGYRVESVSSGESGLRRLSQKQYDLLILDIRLPGIDGFEVCRRLRKKGEQVPILMLTVRDDVADKVRGLGLGADDYLTKPFEFSELVARVKSLLRRKMPLKKLTAGNLTLNLESGKVARGQHAAKLTPKEFNLLKFLMGNQGRVLAREKISQKVWGRKNTENLVDVTIFSLRKKIAFNFKKELIKTVRGKGYKMGS